MPQLRLVVGDSHFGVLLPRNAVAAEFRSPVPPPSPAFVKYVVPSLCDATCGSQQLQSHTAAAAQVLSFPRCERQLGGDAVEPPAAAGSPVRSSTSARLPTFNPLSPSAFNEFACLPPSTAVYWLIEHLQTANLSITDRFTIGIIRHVASLLGDIETVQPLLDLQGPLNAAQSSAHGRLTPAMSQLLSALEAHLVSFQLAAGISPAGLVQDLGASASSDVDNGGCAVNGCWDEDNSVEQCDQASHQGSAPVGDPPTAACTVDDGRSVSVEQLAVRLTLLVNSTAAPSALSVPVVTASLSVVAPAKAGATTRPATCPVCLRSTRRQRLIKKDGVEAQNDVAYRSPTCRSSGHVECRYTALSTLSVADLGHVIHRVIGSVVLKGSHPSGGTGPVPGGVGRARLRQAAGQGFATSQAAADAAVTAATTFSSDVDPPTEFCSRASMIVAVCSAALEAEAQWRATAAGVAALHCRQALADAKAALRGPTLGDAADSVQQSDGQGAVCLGDTPENVQQSGGQSPVCSLCGRMPGERSKSKCSGHGNRKCIAVFRGSAKSRGLFGQSWMVAARIDADASVYRGVAADRPADTTHTTLLSALEAAGVQHVLLFGLPGTGKSHLLQRLAHLLKAALPRGGVSVVAAFGLVALNISGCTLHSWAGLTRKETLFSVDGGKTLSASSMLDHVLKYQPRAASRWREVVWLLIDEASLISAELFDALEELARRLRRNDTFFGGIRLVLAFDFLQLFPVTSDDRPRMPLFCSAHWHRLVNTGLCVELTEQHRHPQDGALLEILSAARNNRFAPGHRLWGHLSLSRPLSDDLQACSLTLAPHRETVSSLHPIAPQTPLCVFC